MAKQSVKQAREVADTFTRRIPKDLLTSGNCVTVPVGNSYSVGRHVFEEGQHLIVDCDAVPKHDDFVIVFGSMPFGRRCHVAPAPEQNRDDMIMGTLDSDGETVCMIPLGKGGRSFGVVVNVLPAGFFDLAETAATQSRSAQAGYRPDRARN
jgi:hypothetical protein